MPVDNSIYETLDDWWDPTGQVAGLHAMNPARSAYFVAILRHRLDLGLAPHRVLEIGCGGGLLTEELSRAGFAVTGIDAALGALRVAADHARGSGLAPAYVGGDAFALPFPPATFAAVVTSDFLEHVSDVRAVVGEAARVITPGGGFLYDTINRTIWTRIFHIGVLQEWKKLVPRDTHDWRQFVRPGELRRALVAAGLEPVETRGLLPERPLRFALALLAHRRGRDRMLPFRIGDRQELSYIGWARKPS